MNSAFSRLSPFIQEYIYKHRWDELRPIQEEACKVIFDTDDHLILSSGTASGKTEAAFLPILSMLEEDPPASVGVLYIAPMKALINDQFYRLTDLLEQSNIPLCHWHGDVPRSKKTKFLQNPRGVLQITPESLESMLITRIHDLVRIFGDLRFVVIDEMHAFMNAERGLQVLCQLARLRKYVNADFRRVGLSATLGDYELPSKWLSAGTSRNVSIPQVNLSTQKIRLSVEHFPESLSDNEDTEYFGNFSNFSATKYMYEHSLDKKAILFGNCRNLTDEMMAAVRRHAELNNTPDIYHVHHGSISATLREYAEQDIKNSENPVVIGATVTMELGVDIGRLQRVFQMGSPISVASFVQRLGRTGRRGEPPEMWFVHCENKMNPFASPIESIPWYLLKIIAIIQLYVEERWIEPPNILEYSMSMLYHQTMSIVAGIGEISLQGLVDAVISLPVFYNLDKNDLVFLIDTLIQTEHLQLMEQGGIIIGLEGEKIINSYDFYGVFPTEEEWIVMHGSEKIGQIQMPAHAGEQVTVAGYNWVVVGVDYKRLNVFVKPAKKRPRTLWHGDRAPAHDRILQRMKEVLCEQTEYPYLGEKALVRLRQARQVAKQYGYDKYNVFDMENGQIAILPWFGHRNYRTLRNIISYYMKEKQTGLQIGGHPPFYITFKTENRNAAAILDELRMVLEKGVDPYDFFFEEKIRSEKKHYEYKVPKYDRYIPNVLLKRQVIEDYVDLGYIKSCVDDWL